MNRNIAAVKDMYECFARGNIPGILEHLRPDVEWEHDWGGPTLKWYQPRRGRAEVPKFFQMLTDFEFLRFEPFAFLEGADMIAVPVHIELIVKATGKRIRDLEMHLWTFDTDGRVSRFRHLVDTQQHALASGTS